MSVACNAGNVPLRLGARPKDELAHAPNVILEAASGLPLGAVNREARGRLAVCTRPRDPYEKRKESNVRTSLRLRYVASL
jgi:hypothetical protein